MPGSAHPTGNNRFLIQTYATAYLSMTAFRDGDANSHGILLGAAIIAVAANGLTILAMPTSLRDILTSLSIVTVVLVRNVGRKEQ